MENWVILMIQAPQPYRSYGGLITLSVQGPREMNDGWSVSHVIPLNRSIEHSIAAEVIMHSVYAHSSYTESCWTCRSLLPFRPLCGGSRPFPFPDLNVMKTRARHRSLPYILRLSDAFRCYDQCLQGWRLLRPDASEWPPGPGSEWTSH